MIASPAAASAAGSTAAAGAGAGDTGAPCQGGGAGAAKANGAASAVAVANADCRAGAGAVTAVACQGSGAVGAAPPWCLCAISCCMIDGPGANAAVGIADVPAAELSGTCASKKRWKSDATLGGACDKKPAA